MGLSGLEELGFGKGGLDIGGISAGGGVFYIDPTIGFRNKFGATPMYGLTSVGAGFAYSGQGSGAGFRGAYDLFIGTFTVVGLEGFYLLPVINTDAGVALRGYLGLHIGIAIGN